ncbi:MAG: dienelactone hydrolase family protein [Acidobacteriota bacterium]
MQIATREIDVSVEGRPMRTVIAAPRPKGRYPGILLFSEIFQLTGPIRRSAERLAGHGFVVAAPEIFHRLEPPGLVIPYDDAGRMRGQDDAARTSVAQFDADRAAALDALDAQPDVVGACLGAVGFCIGGHLAFRAALDPRVRAAVCCYPTGLHDGRVGSSPDVGSLARAGEITGQLLVVFGEADPHVPEEGRWRVAESLAAAGERHRVALYPGEHAFMRDEGPRFDAQAADAVWGEMINLFRNAFS